MVKGILVNYQGNEITTAIYDQQIWFSFEDIKKLVDIENCELYFEESVKINVDGNTLQMINEFGLYRLLCLNVFDRTKDFRKWLINDAIIRLRKYGCYKLSIAEEKEKTINEIEKLLINLKSKTLDVEKLKYFSLDKLKIEKSYLEDELKRQEKEKEIAEKRNQIKKDYPYVWSALVDDYDINRAIEDLEFRKENLDDYMICVHDNEYWFNERFVNFVKNKEYEL